MTNNRIISLIIANTNRYCKEVVLALTLITLCSIQSLAAASGPSTTAQTANNVLSLKSPQSIFALGKYRIPPSSLRINSFPDNSNLSILVLYENGGHHLAFSKAAIPWLNRLAATNHFVIQYIQNTDSINSSYLAKFQLFIQLDYPPYTWSASAMLAFKTAIEKGTIGWLGLHHATLLGEFDGYPMWNWFSWFMGGIRFKNYIADFASADVTVKDSLHPVMRGIPSRFLVQREEWYTWDKEPDSSYIHVLADVDESSYYPDSEIKMHSKHPVIWTNTRVKAKNLYIFMGHDPGLWSDTIYQRLFKSAVLWTAGLNAAQ